MYGTGVVVFLWLFDFIYLCKLVIITKQSCQFDSRS